MPSRYNDTSLFTEKLRKMSGIDISTVILSLWQNGKRACLKDVRAELCGTFGLNRSEIWMGFICKKAARQMKFSHVHTGSSGRDSQPIQISISWKLFFSYSTLETTVVVCESAFCWSMSKGRHVVLTCPDFSPDLPTIHLVQTPECTQSNNMEGTTCALEGEPFKTQTKTSQIWQQDEWLGLAKCRQLHNTPPEYIKVHRQPRRHTTIC